MELASRILSILLGAAVMVFVLWPVTIPVGFGEVWWASRQAKSPAKPPPAEAPESRSEAMPAATTIAPAAAPSPHAAPPAAAEQTAAAPDQANAAADQLAALKETDKTGAVTPQAVAPQTQTELYRRITVRDGGTLQAGKVVIRLAGIAARETDAICKGDDGKTWRCGAAAKAALTRLIRARAVSCTLPKAGEHNIFVARCAVGGTDLSTWLVRQGWAEPKDASEPALAEAAKAAKAERIGAWRARE